MFKKGSAAVVALTAAFAASHFGAPPASMPAVVLPSGVHAFSGALTPKLTLVGGCSAYGAFADGRPHSDPEDENAGSATRVITGFFGLPANGSKPLPPEVRYAIVLAPDPRHTNLSLVFDREMALLVQAAQDQGYDYNSSWLPWSTDSAPALDHLGERQSADDLNDQRENCPGVILFRRRSESGAAAFSHGLVVLVVGEQATGGINQGQWKNAVGWLAAYSSPAKPLAPEKPDQRAGDGILRILGPTFTGSLPSLSRDLKDLYDPEGSSAGLFRDRFPLARILSGSVSNCSAIQSFELDLPRPAPNAPSAAPPWHIDFGTFQENDSVHIYRFLKYLNSQGTRPADIAILSEDETAYAAREQMASPCDFPYAEDNRPTHLVFPRDISALRNAYEKQAVFDSATAGLKEHSHPILHDEAPAEGTQPQITDTIPASSGSVAAVDQEAYLYGVVSILRTHHARYLVLRCTNPLDFLFLTRFFHRAYPQARIVTLGADLLFRREIDTTEFRGVLSLSSYPLLPRAQHWSRITEDKWEEQNHNHLVFPGNMAEGMYMAARYSLLAGYLPDPDSDPVLGRLSNVPLIPPAAPDARSVAPLQMYRALPMPDYSDPFWFHPGLSLPQTFATYPPTWINAVGRDGYWPIAVVEESLIPGNCLENEDGECRSAAPSAPPPLSTILHLINAPPSLFPAPAGTQRPPNALDQHYEFNPPATNGGTRTFDHRLLIPLPLPWKIASLLACALLGYQIWGLSKCKVNPADGLFSVFRLAADQAHGVLMGLSCALALMLLFELAGVALVPASFTLVSDSTGSIAVLRVGLVISFLAMLFWLVWRKLSLARVDRRPSPGYLPWTLSTYILSFLFFTFLYRLAYLIDLNELNDVPLFYRMIHITDGVSPLLPILFLTFGFYLWNWQAMAGSLIVSRGCPELPRLRGEGAVKRGWFQLGPIGRTGCSQPEAGVGCNTLKPQFAHISQTLGRQILNVAHPLCFATRIIAGPTFLFISACVCFEGTRNLPLLGMESRWFNEIVDGILVVAMLFTATEALRLYSTWIKLRTLLLSLGRLNLRRTICRLRPVEANSIWSVSGSVRRVQYDLFHAQLDAARRFIRLTDGNPLGDTPCTCINAANDYGEQFIRCIESQSPVVTSWSTLIAPPATPGAAQPPEPRMLRDVLADATGELCNVLSEIWAKETKSLNLDGFDASKEEDAKQIPLSRDARVRAAEEFVAYHYIAFIQNIVARMRTMTLSMIFLFITVCLAISFYPFVPRTETGVWLMINLVLIGGAVAYVYAGMERNLILSYIANSEPGRLGTAFYLRLAAFLAGPLIGILTTEFPSITDTVLQWLQPGLDAIK